MGITLFFCVGTAAIPPGGLSAMGASAESIQKQKSAEFVYEPIILAQTGPQPAESETRSTDGRNDPVSEPETAPAEKDGKTGDESPTKSIKPFKPSEEIAAEQAVDFPVDI